MSDFKSSDLNQALLAYLYDFVELEIVDYIGGPGMGINIDVGEVHNFSLRFINNGSLGMLNVVTQVTTNNRGQVSNTNTGIGSDVFSGWIDFRDAIVMRPINLQPHQTFVMDHAVGTNRAFGYQANHVTGGTDNNRDIEPLISAKIISWEPDIQSLVVGNPTGPNQAVFESFIQRT